MAIHKIDGVDAVDGGSVITSFPKKFVTLFVDDNVTAGQWVMIDTGDTTNGLGASITPALAGGTTGTALTFGVATETVAAGGECRVQTAGKFVDASCNSVSAGDALVVNNASAGRAVTYASGTHTAAPPCGVALESDSANLADVLIIDQGYF